MQELTDPMANRIPLPFAPLLLLFTSTAPAAGHDLWLAPSTYTPAPGEVVRVHLRVGDQVADAEPVARDPERIVRFEAVAAGSSHTVPGMRGQDPAGLLPLPNVGLVTLVYQGKPRPHRLAADRFAAYLAEEGLDAVLAAREAAGETEREGRELYARTTKALLAVGGSAAAREAADQPLGLPFELVARSNPYAGGPVTVEALWQGEPVAGVLVEAKPLAAPTTPARAGDRPAGASVEEGERAAASSLALRTDASGRAVFTLPHGGPWGLFAVHMVPATVLPAAERADADWLSYWATLSFELPALAAPGLQSAAE
jgi:uncharacterized GH25 family protein